MGRILVKRDIYSNERSAIKVNPGNPRRVLQSAGLHGKGTPFGNHQSYVKTADSRSGWRGGGATSYSWRLQEH